MLPVQPPLDILRKLSPHLRELEGPPPGSLVIGPFPPRQDGATGQIIPAKAPEGLSRLEELLHGFLSPGESVLDEPQGSMVIHGRTSFGSESVATMKFDPGILMPEGAYCKLL